MSTKIQRNRETDRPGPRGGSTRGGPPKNNHDLETFSEFQTWKMVKMAKMATKDICMQAIFGKKGKM